VTTSSTASSEPSRATASWRRPTSRPCSSSPGSRAFSLNYVSFFLGRETVIPSRRKAGMALWRERIFAFLSRNAQTATAFYGIPPDRVMEIGIQIEI